MKVLRLHGPADVRLEETAEPSPGPDEELVLVTAVGLCGSDLHWYEDGGIGDARLAHPLVLGHEVGGVIASGPREGLRVALDPADPCERCPTCRAGHGNLCPDVRFLGHGTTDGALRTLMAWPARHIRPVPDAIPDEQVPLLESLGIAIHGAELGHVRAGMSAGVYGCGPIGLLLIAALQAMGVGPILATDRLAHRLEAARSLGASEVRAVGPDGVPEGVAAWGPVDVAFEVVGDDGALATAVHTVRVGGRVVVVGIPGGDDRTSFQASLARRKGLALVLSRRMRAHHLDRAIELVRTGQVDLSSLVTERYPLAEGKAAFEAAASRRGLKVLVMPAA